jgi:5-methylcytosine-specific restriction endonuclease McrA
MTDVLLNLIASRLGLDHDRVLGSRFAFPLMGRYLSDRNGHFENHRERDRLLYWYVHTILWGRYAGSTETVLNQDLGLIEDPEGALDRLIEQLAQQRGDLKVRPNDFLGWSRGARFYPLLYMLTRVWKAKDWETGVELSAHLLGSLSALQVHHIFPKDLLYKAGYHRPDVNAIANFTFLTQETNLLVTNRDPAEYLEVFADKSPGAIESHWIPLDRELWKIENYPKFLEARRELLAAAANEFLDNLLKGAVPEAAEEQPSILDRTGVSPTIESGEEEATLEECSSWLAGLGLPPGEPLFEVGDAETGEPIAVLDLAWPRGLQEGLSQPVTLLIDEPPEIEAAANDAGFRAFRDLPSFKAYVEEEILARTASDDQAAG